MTDTMETNHAPATKDDLKSSMEKVTSRLYETTDLNQRLQVVKEKLTTRSFLRKEIKQDSKHNPQVLSLIDQIDQDIKSLKEEEKMLMDQLVQANKRFLKKYQKVTNALLDSEIGVRLKQDIESAVNKKIQDEINNLSTSTSNEIQRTLDAYTQQSVQEFDKMKADSTNQKSRLEQHIEDCTKRFDTISPDMRKSSRSTPSSSEDYPIDRRLLNELKDFHKYLKRVDIEGKGIANNNSLDILHTRFKKWQEETAKQLDSVYKRNEELQKKSLELETVTRDYNRRSSEIDIVYDKIKAQMDTLKKESGKLQARTGQINDTPNDITDIRAQLAKLKAQVGRKVTENDARRGMESELSNSNEPTDIKALQILESRITLLEQTHKFKLKELEDTIKDLRQLRKDGDKNDNGKRPRTDDFEAGTSEIKLQMNKQAVQMKELMAFLEPLRSTVLGDTFAENLQTSMDQLISVARRHESDIDHIHTALKQAAHAIPKKTTSNTTPELESTLEAQFNTHKRRMKEKHTLIMETLEDFKSSFTKSEEKQQKQQIEIDKLQQQLVRTTSVLQTLQNACSQRGILPEEMGDK